MGSVWSKPAIATILVVQAEGSRWSSLTVSAFSKSSRGNLAGPGLGCRSHLSGLEIDPSGGWRGIVLDQEPGGWKGWLPMGLILLNHDGANTIHSVPGVDGIPGWDHIVSNQETR